MDIRYTQEQVMLRNTTRRFLEEHCQFNPLDRRLAVDMRQRALWTQCAELGLAALTVSEAAGGIGGSPIDRSIVMEEMGRSLASLPFLSNAVLAATLLEKSAGRAELLGGLADGSIQISLADQEAAGGLGARAIECTAAQLGSADGWLLSGRKVAVLGGPTADWFIVSARGVDEDAFGLYLIAATAPGLHIRPHAAIDGSSIAELRLDNVPCDAHMCLLSGNEAVVALEEARDHALVALGSEAVGICEAVISTTRDYLSVRKQFGRPLAAFQALQHRMAEMYVETQKLRGQVLAAMASLAGRTEQRHRHASAVKVQIAAAGLFVTGQGIQLHGGNGMTEDYVIGHYFKRMTVIDMLFGTSSQHLQRYIASTINDNGDKQ